MASQSRLRGAWISVVLIPVLFVVGFAVGEGAYAIMGYRPEDGTAPLWADLVVSLVVLVVVLTPCVLAVHFGRTAVKTGERSGVYPAAIGAVAGLALIALTVATAVGDQL